MNLHINSHTTYRYSGQLAKDRLKLMLVTDRINCSPELMELMKNDVFNVVSKYVEVSKASYSFSISSSPDVASNLPMLIAKLPIKQKKPGEQYV